MSIYSKSIVIFLYTVFFASCSKLEQKNRYSEKEFQARLDSMKAASMIKLEQEAKEDLDRRLSIEIKPLVDSILKREVLTPNINIPDESIDTTFIEEEQENKPLQPIPAN